MTVSVFNPNKTPTLTAVEQAACAQLKIQLGNPSPEFTTGLLSHPTPGVLSTALLLHQQAEPRLDVKASGAYLVNRLAWDISAVLAWLDLNHYDLSALTPETLGVHSVIEREWHKGEWHRYVVYQFALTDLNATGETLPPEVVAGYAYQLFEHLIPALAAQVRLSANALWRLVTDGLSAAYLYVGKEQQQPDRAMARVRAVIEAAGKPLANKQWQFNYYSVAAEDSPTQQPLGNWFRARGGCCRYYTLEGKDYCTSCVHVSEDERRERLTRYLCNHAIEATE
ncbi:MAG: (2Fe-2S)-binding protein [Natronospirillum sp.]